MAEVLVHIDHDYDIKRPSGEGKPVDVDVRDRIAKKFRHLGDALGIDLPPAPLAAGGPKLVVHGAVVVVAGDEQAARTVRRPHQPHEQLDLLPLLQRLPVHLQLPRQLSGGRWLEGVGCLGEWITLDWHDHLPYLTFIRYQVGVEHGSRSSPWLLDCGEVGCDFLDFRHHLAPTPTQLACHGHCAS